MTWYVLILKRKPNLRMFLYHQRGALVSCKCYLCLCFPSSMEYLRGRWWSLKKLQLSEILSLADCLSSSDLIYLTDLFIIFMIHCYRCPHDPSLTSSCYCHTGCTHIRFIVLQWYQAVQVASCELALTGHTQRNVALYGSRPPALCSKTRIGAAAVQTFNQIRSELLLMLLI